MAASQEQIEKIQGILQEMDEHLQKPASDNRRAPRMNVRMSLVVMLLSGAGPTPVDVYTRNLSVSGIGFVSRRLFRREERLAVILRIPNLPSKLILSRVTFGRYVNNGLYEMGAEFLESISDPRGQGTIPRKWLTTPIAPTKPAAVPASADAAAAPAAKPAPVPAVETANTAAAAAPAA